MIFGGVCPSVTSIIAESLEGWNLVQVGDVLYIVCQCVYKCACVSVIWNVYIVLYDWETQVHFVQEVSSGVCISLECNENIVTCCLIEFPKILASYFCSEQIGPGISKGSQLMA